MAQLSHRLGDLRTHCLWNNRTRHHAKSICRAQCTSGAPVDSARTCMSLDRRTVLFGALAAIQGSLAPSSKAGMLDGTVEWWKGRKRANSAKLIAPIKVAQQRLEAAAAMLADGSGSMLDVLQLVRASSLNCYTFEALPGDSLETRASLLTQAANLSDPCTFRIIVKNVVDFAPPEAKERGAALLSSLILAYQKLDSEAEAAALEAGWGAGAEGAEGRAQVGQQLAATLALTRQVEGFVREMLAVV